MKDDQMPDEIWCGNMHVSENGKFKCGEFVNHDVGGAVGNKYIRADLVPENAQQPVEADGFDYAAARILLNRVLGRVRREYQDEEFARLFPEWRAIDHALETMTAIAEGKCQVVPVEPTELILEAGGRYLGLGNKFNQAQAERIYKAMIAAAPTLPETGSDDE